MSYHSRCTCLLSEEPLVAQTTSLTSFPPCHKQIGRCSEHTSQSTEKYVTAQRVHSDWPDTNSTTTNTRFPDEVLRLTFRLATLDEDSLKPTFSQPKEIATYRFMEGVRSYEPFANKWAIARVCSQWRDVVAQFLYEYVRQWSLVALVLELTRFQGHHNLCRANPAVG